MKTVGNWGGLAVSFLFLVFSFSASATSLKCGIKENGSVVQTASAQSALNQKIATGSTQMTRAFVTEKENGVFVVEAFLTDYEARLYAQGSLKTASDQLIATLWTRDSLIEVSCQLAQ